MKHFFITHAWLACIALSCMLPGFCQGKEDKKPKHSLESKCGHFKHNIQLQLADTNGSPVAGTEFWVTLDIIKDGSEVTVLLPLINFQTGPSNPGAPLPGGYLYTTDGFLPEELRPNDVVWRSIVAASNNGLSLPFSFAQPIDTLPVPPVGYIVQVTNFGGLVVQCAGTFGNIIPNGPQNLLPCAITFSTKPRKKLSENFVISNGFTDTTQFTNGGSANNGFRPTHINAAHGGVMAWAWSDNSTVQDKTNGTLNLMVAVGKVDKHGNVKICEPIQLTNFPANVQAWSTSIAINPRDPKNIVVSYGISDNVNFQFPACRAVSFDGGKTWPAPYEYIAFNGSLSGDILTVFPDEIFNGTLAVGQNIYAYTLPVGQAGIVPGTTITAQLSGTPGGAGTYQVSPGNQSVPATFIIASPPLNGQIPIFNPQSDGWIFNTGVQIDKCGNVWYGSSEFADTLGNFTGQPIFAASADKGVTFQNILTLPVPASTSEFYDYPQYCFGNDDTGQYGLYFSANFAVGPDQFPIVGFMPIFGFNNFGTASSTQLTNFLNDNTRKLGITASNDGRVWLQGREPEPSRYSQRFPIGVVFKSPGAIDVNYAGPWNTVIVNALAHQDSQPVVGYNLPHSIQSILYDDKRQALYALTAVPFPDFSQNMRIYFIISRDNGQTWSNPIDISTTDFANRGFQSMALDSCTGDLVLGWYDGRNDSTFKSVQYFGARIPAKKLDTLVKAIPLSNPLFSIPSQAGTLPQVDSEKVAELLPLVPVMPQKPANESLQEWFKKLSNATA